MLPRGLSDGDLKAAGFVPGIHGYRRGPFDPPQCFEPREDQPDDIWEEADGLYTVYQQKALLSTEPKLWAPVTDWRLGLHELSEPQMRKRSSFEVDALLLLHATKQKAISGGMNKDGD